MEYSTELLLKIQQNLGEIEIPGQYYLEQNKPSFKEFEPEKHVLIATVDRNIDVIFENRKLARCITFNGNKKLKTLHASTTPYNIKIENVENDESGLPAHIDFSLA